MATDESLPVFQAPCCLIENCPDGTLKICSDVLNQLSKISSPLNVIAITGPCRTGKSYLLNCLAGKRKGFLLGSTFESVTKGIWVWCRRHPERPNEVIVLLDTEGLGDIEKGNPENDYWIFAISVLMSSTLVYNCFATINQDGLSQLHYVTELTQRIKTKSISSNRDGGDFYRIFPNFVWIVRDVYNRLIKNGQPITPDQYLDGALAPKEGTGTTVDNFNRPRQCIINFFAAKKCFVFPIPPKDPEKMAELETLPESEFNPRFLSEAKRFSSCIYTDTFPKTANGQPIHGRMFCNLLEDYVTVIQKGEIPCVGDAVKTMAEKENIDALKVSVNVYVTQMKERSINSKKELSEAHQDCSRMALERFMSMSKLDEKQKYQSELKNEIDEKFKQICHEKGMAQGGAESMKDKKIAELNAAVNNLEKTRKKLQEEKENLVKELERKIQQRDNECKTRGENQILRKQVEEMKEDKKRVEEDLTAIREGGASFAKFLDGAGSVLVGTLKVSLLAVGVVAYTLARTAGTAVVGAVAGGRLAVTLDEKGVSVAVAPVGVVVGGVAGGVIGLVSGVYEAINYILEHDSFLTS